MPKARWKTRQGKKKVVKNVVKASRRKHSSKVAPNDNVKRNEHRQQGTREAIKGNIKKNIKPWEKGPKTQ